MLRWTLLLSVVVSQALAQAGLKLLEVDVSKSNIPLSEILSGGPPPQGIPALGFSGDRTGSIAASAAAKFIPPGQATWLGAEEPVVGFRLGSEAKAYPLQILTWHEIVNDTVAGVPVAVTFCPLCNSALSFDRRIPLTDEQRQAVLKLNPRANIQPLDAAFRTAYQAQEGRAAPPWGLLVTFGTSGMLYQSNLLMFDSATNTLFSQILGEGHVGTLMGITLLRYPAQILSFAEFRQSGGIQVLSRETGFSRNYGRNPYVGYDRADERPFLFQGPIDGRLPPKERVITVQLTRESVAYPFSVLSKARVINDNIGSTPLTLFWQPGTRSALDTASILSGRDIGAVGVFERRVGQRVLTFEWDGKGFVDKETRSRWNLLGVALEGLLKGTQLKEVIHDNTLWFAWVAFKPQTRVFGLNR